MVTCFQTPGQNIWQHGEAVAARYKDLIGPQQLEWKLPDWLDLSLLFSLCPSPEVMETYHLWHDCSKPFVRTVDAVGRQHFPNHAVESERLWLQADGDSLIGRLIGCDMDFHTLKPSQLKDYEHLDLAPALLLTALCELHANAGLFGGLESTSFCIKFSNLNRLGKAAVKLLKEKQNEI